MPFTQRVILWYDEATDRVKYGTHAKFDEGFNDLPADNLPPNCQQILRRNGSPMPMDDKEITTSDLEFFVYPFADKENATVPVLPSTKDDSFGFKLQDDDLYGRTYIKDLNDTKSSSAAKVFGDTKRSRRKLRGAFITHIDGAPVFSTSQAQAKFASLYEDWKQAKKQGVADDFSFEITFAREEKLTGKKLKRAIDDYHFLTPGTTKRIKSKDVSSEEDEIDTDVDDGSERFKIGFKIYKLFDGIPYKGTVVGYDETNKLYKIKYDDGDAEQMYHNEVYLHKDPIKTPNVSTKASNVSKKASNAGIEVKKRKDIRRKYQTRSWKRQQRGNKEVAMNQVSNVLYLTKLAPTEDDFEEHEHQLCIDDLRAIASLRQTRKDKNVDMSEEAIPTEVIKLVINTLGSDAITPEEQKLGYFTRKKLKRLSTWDQWLAGETKQIDRSIHESGDVWRATVS